MDKKEINSPRLTANFLFRVCGVGGVLLIGLLGHYVWKIFLDAFRKNEGSAQSRADTFA